MIRANRMRRHHALTALLIFQTFILFVGVPVASGGTSIPLASAAVLVTITILILVSISSGITAKIVASGAILLAVACGVFRISHPTTPLAIWLGHGAVLLAVVAMSLVVGRVVFGPGRVTAYRIQGALVLYLNIGIAFTSAFRLIADLSPGAFTNINPGISEGAATAAIMYFSFTALSSTGFGDILPIHPMARSLANLESILGQIYIATLLGRLVTLHIAGGRE